MAKKFTSAAAFIGISVALLGGLGGAQVAQHRRLRETRRTPSQRGPGAATALNGVDDTVARVDAASADPGSAAQAIPPATAVKGQPAPIQGGPTLAGRAAARMAQRLRQAAP